MSITATVENDIIRLPSDAPFPNGAQVRVELVDPPRIAPEVLAWLERAKGGANSGLTTDEIMKMTRGEE